MSQLETEYDPDRPEGSPGGSNYLSRRDFKLILLGFILIFAAMIPVYIKFREDARSYECMENIKAAGQALATYAALNDDHLPPAFDREGDQPRQVNGLPLTWATLVYSGMNKRKQFICPTATNEELTYSAGTEGRTNIPLSFGYYVPMEFQSVSNLKDPDSTILLAETVKGVVDGTYNPMPMPGGNDGYSIGYDTGNDASVSTVENATAVTRLAFFKTNNGQFGPKTVSRHAFGIHVLYASGRVGLLKPQGALIQRDFGGDIGRPWMLPPRSVINGSR